MFSRISILLCSATVVSLTACGPHAVALEPGRVKRFNVVPPAGRQFCGNDDFVSLKAVVHYEDGTRLSTRSRGGNWLKSDEVTWSSDAVVVDDGVVSVAPDRPAWLGQPIVVRAALTKRPEIRDEITLEPRYDCGQHSLRGSAGSHGDDGEPGGPGAPGGSAQVALTYLDRPGGARMVLVRIRDVDSGAVHHYVIDARAPAGIFVVNASGGSGGAGGEGPSGARGHRGRDGRPGFPGRDGADCTAGRDGGDGRPGEDGEDGRAGAPGGDGGDGGSITIEYDERFPELPRYLSSQIDGGAPGSGGDGGLGGDGGRGGEAGAGGAGGSDHKDGKTTCQAAAGRAGRPGPDGRSGDRGAPGVPGRPGRPGSIRAVAADVSRLFAPEIAKGVGIVPVAALDDAAKP